MIFTGKQIRINFTDGDMKVYRGGAYSLEVVCYESYSWVTIYLNGKEYANFPSESIDKVVEDSFGAETLK